MTKIIREHDGMVGRYHMLVVLMSRGYRNGYLGIPRDEFHRMISDDPGFMDRIDVHGGVTYEGGDLRLIGHDGFNYIGFDCNHTGDGLDTEALVAHGIPVNETFALEMKDGEVRSASYVMDELWRMLYQIRDEDSLMMSFCVEKHGMGIYEDWITGSLAEEDIPDDMKLFAELNGIMY